MPKKGNYTDDVSPLILLLFLILILICLFFYFHLIYYHSPDLQDGVKGPIHRITGKKKTQPASEDAKIVLSS